MEIFNQEFRDLLQSTGLSQRAFALKFQIPRRTVENWCTDKSTIPPYVLGMLKTILESEKGTGQ